MKRGTWIPDPEIQYLQELGVGNERRRDKNSWVEKK